LPANPVDCRIREAPTFWPTEEDFRDPLACVFLGLIVVIACHSGGGGWLWYCC
ncbi:unnamed protein product, partial [Pylaiella littoralis]